jgi:hypothetical protein
VFRIGCHELQARGDLVARHQPDRRAAFDDMPVRDEMPGRTDPEGRAEADSPGFARRSLRSGIRR